MSTPRVTSGAGRVLGGRYILLTPIAQGSMGEVQKARSCISGHIVAAKVLRLKLTGEGPSLSRLRLEARNSMSISYSNIADVQDSGEEDGIGWIITELADGYPLTGYLRGGSRIEPEYPLPILVQVAMAPGTAVRAGVIYYDIKPANIIVRADGMVKLTDFGISRAKGQVSLTAAGMVMGTVQYLPPEQVMNEVTTPIGDLYILGVIAYEAAAGRRSLTDKIQVDITFVHVNDPVSPLSDFMPELLTGVTLRLLERDPAERPEPGSAAVCGITNTAKTMGVSIVPCPLPLPEVTQHPEEVCTPVQPSVPIAAPVHHLTRRTLPDGMLQPPSEPTPKVYVTTGRHAKLPVPDEATTITPSSTPIPITGHRAAIPRIFDEAEVPPVLHPVSAPIRVRRLHPETVDKQPSTVLGAVRSLTSAGRYTAVPIPLANPPIPVPAPIPTRSTAKTAPMHLAPAPAAPVPAQAIAPKTLPPSEPQDQYAALAERLRQRVAARQAEDTAKEQRHVATACEEERRQRKFRGTRRCRGAREHCEAEEAKCQVTPRIPQPARSESSHRDKAVTASLPRVYGTVPQPRVATPSKH